MLFPNIFFGYIYNEIY
jgi:hypothetical protein